MSTIKAGRATNKGLNGADYWLLRYGKLPGYYIPYKAAKTLGWMPEEGNLHEVLPGRMITRGTYWSKNGKLPSTPGREWYEADYNYTQGQRGTERIVYSSDGLVFATDDHYETFTEIV